MNEAAETTQAPAKMPAFKSKKELVALVGAAVVFAFVIYKMYLSKGDEPSVMAGPAEAPVASAASPQNAQPLSPAALDMMAQLRTGEAEVSAGTESPATLKRNPFAMTITMHARIYGAQTQPQENTASSEPVLLTAENFSAVLSQIPGAEEAAAKGLTLEAVMSAGTWRGASINGQIMQLGDTILGFKLVEVLEDRVVLQCEQHRVALPVRSSGSPTPDKSGTPNSPWRTPQ